MTDEKELEEYIDGLGLRHFRGKELTWLWKRSRKGITNHCPPRRLWANVARPLIVLDRVREELGAPMRITSAYRCPEYNRAVGGETQSYHLIFQALDVTCRLWNPASVAAKVRSLRGQRFRLPDGASFVFRGGVGEYPGFVHIDTRGKDANW